MEANAGHYAAEEPDSPPGLEYGRRPRAINDENEDPDTEGEVMPRVEDPGVRHAKCVAEPANLSSEPTIENKNDESEKKHQKELSATR